MNATKVKERPILMCGWKVRRILDWDFAANGDMQTRRIIKPQPFWTGGHWRFEGKQATGFNSEDCMRDMLPIYCPFGSPDERLWVKEKWQQIQVIGPREYRTVHRTKKLSWPHPIYAADDNRDEPPSWMPSIHMPRWASRITLEITDVMVQRVQDISGDECSAEGIEPQGIGSDMAMRAAFAKQWNEINGKESWEANPFCWIISFRRL